MAGGLRPEHAGLSLADHGRASTTSRSLFGSLRERGRRRRGRPASRYALRLGNHRYPFMKFVVQEHLVSTSEYFFSVDTHDNLEIRPDSAGLRGVGASSSAYNRELKAEHRSRPGTGPALPTNTRISRRSWRSWPAWSRRSSEAQDDPARGRRVRTWPAGLAALLRARGYDCRAGPRRAGRRSSAWARAGSGAGPGAARTTRCHSSTGRRSCGACGRIERTADLPVLLATASQIDLSRLRRVSGLLRKPYPRHVLFEMIARLLEPREEAPPRD